MQKTRKKILVALSGGVDSSVAALILKQKGYEVIAAFMNFWSEEQNNLCYNKCCSLESARRARAIARKLKIKLEYAWSGTFGKTNDSIPYINKSPKEITEEIAVKSGRMAKKNLANIFVMKYSRSLMI